MISALTDSTLTTGAADLQSASSRFKSAVYYDRTMKEVDDFQKAMEEFFRKLEADAERDRQRAKTAEILRSTWRSAHVRKLVVIRPEFHARSNP